MSKLEELIQELCPDGVQYAPLWTLTAWDKKFKSVEKHKQSKIKKYKYYLANELQQLESEEGTVKILTTNVSDLWANECDVKNDVINAEIVCIPWGGNPIVQYFNGKFITGDNRIATSLDTKVLDNKFLYYLLENNLDIIKSFYRGSGLKHPDMSKVLDMIIPVPPLEVQKEIVRLLDKFTAKTAELQAELNKEYEARKKQYKYQKEKLLTQNNGATTYTISELCSVSAGGDAPKNAMSKEITKEYTIPIISNGVRENAIYGYTNKAKIYEPAVTLAARGTIGYAEYRDYPYVPIIRLLSLIPKNTQILDTKYLYHCLVDKEYTLPTTGIPQLTAPMVKKIEISLPKIEIQKEIVRILDKYNIFYRDLQDNLNNELESRQKQYEFYRDKLLTFKELNESEVN